jgi:hypothetical protein
VDFPPQRGKQFLAILDVSADQIPAPWKQPARHRTSPHEYSSPIVGDKGTRNQLKRLRFTLTLGKEALGIFERLQRLPFRRVEIGHFFGIEKSAWVASFAP